MKEPQQIILKKILIEESHQRPSVAPASLPRRVIARVPHHETRRERDEQIQSSPTPLFFRVAAFLLSGAFFLNPLLVVYADEIPQSEPGAQAPAENLTISPATEVPPSPPTEVVPPLEVPEVGDGNSNNSLLDLILGTNTPDEATPALGDESTTTETATSTEGENGGGLIGDTETGSTSSSTILIDTGGGSGGEVGTSSIQIDSASSTASATSTDGGTEDADAPDESKDPVHLDAVMTPEEHAREKEAQVEALRAQIREEVEVELRAKCVSYGGEGYYCPNANTAETIVPHLGEKHLSSEPDNDGDKEIFLTEITESGESRTQLTHNTTDDIFPASDGSMKTIVWQSQVAGRWQIAYQKGTSSPEYLTANDFSNGHPTTDGVHIVWQAWLENNWEIVLATPLPTGATSTTLDGVSEPEVPGIHPAWRVQRLTTNEVHDMFPKLAGGMLTWQERDGNTWQVVVYDLSTGSKTTVPASEGASGEDPMLAVLWKERGADGKITYRARDIASGRDIVVGGPNQGQPEAPVTLPTPENKATIPVTGTTTASSTKSDGDADGDIGSTTPPIL